MDTGGVLLARRLSRRGTHHGREKSSQVNEPSMIKIRPESSTEMPVRGVARLSRLTAKTCLAAIRGAFRSKCSVFSVHRTPGVRIIKGGWGSAWSEALGDQLRSANFGPILASIYTYNLTCFIEAFDC